MKEIFDWLREQMNKASFERCGNEGMGGQLVVALDDLCDSINEAEAKWEASEAEIRNKVIEDFAENMKELVTEDGTLYEEYIDEIAEQMKGE